MNFSTETFGLNKNKKHSKQKFNNLFFDGYRHSDYFNKGNNKLLMKK